jgi:head-tail adaptor
METYIAAGKLRRPVQIIDPTVTPTSQDTFGGLPATGQQEPASVGAAQAEIEFLAAYGTSSVQKDQDRVSHKVTIRWRPGIAAQQQVYYIDPEGNAKLLQIRAVNNPEERRHYLILFCLERPDLLAQIQTLPF